MDVTESNKAYRYANKILLLVIILINSVVLIMPWIPKISFAVSNNIRPPKLSIDTSTETIDTSYNHIVIPRIKLDEFIHDGTDESLMHKGVWRRPNTSVPGNDSNTVLVGHRFTYAGSSVFYNLDQIFPGDQIIMIWQGKTFEYIVMEQKVVPPSAVEVEAPSTQEKLTLYTCTPIGSAKDRLVVTATLKEIINE